MANKHPKKPTTFEIYILYRALGEEYYINHNYKSHHICLLKSIKTGEFYYTELSRGKSGWGGLSNSSASSGTIGTTFAKYEFLRGPIYHHFVGYTTKTMKEIEEYANEKNCFIEQNYNVFLRNCQHYVRDVCFFLNADMWFLMETPLDKAASPKELQSTTMETARQYYVTHKMDFN
jgi:hypothetical protein